MYWHFLMYFGLNLKILSCQYIFTNKVSKQKFVAKIGSYEVKKIKICGFIESYLTFSDYLGGLGSNLTNLNNQWKQDALTIVQTNPVDWGKLATLMNAGESLSASSKTYLLKCF